VICLWRVYPKGTAQPRGGASGLALAAVDLGVAAVQGFEQDDRLSYEALPPHPVFLVWRPGHPLTRLAKLAIADRLRYALVASPRRAPAQQLLLEQHGQGRTDPDSGDCLPAISVNSIDLARQIAMQSDALFPGTRAMPEHDMAAGRLVRLDFHIPPMATRYGFTFLTQRTSAPSPARSWPSCASPSARSPPPTRTMLRRGNQPTRAQPKPASRQALAALLGAGAQCGYAANGAPRYGLIQYP
jgi:hypothetical protein